MAYPHHRSQFGDTTFTKVFVGGLAWETPTDEMRRYFDQFGDILEAVIITDKNTGKSKGYGFVTFREPESARRACENPNPVIDGRRANCNIASLGRPRPSSLPRGRNQGGNPSHQQGGAPSYGGVAPPLLPPPLLPPPSPVLYPPYGYPTYSPDYGYHQAVYNNPQVQQQPQYYHHQMYATTSTPLMGSPYYYGYSLQSPRGTYSAPHAQRLPPAAAAAAAAGPSYLYYHTNMEGTLFPPPSPTTLQLPRHPFRLSSGSSTPQETSAEAEARAVVTSESPNT